jgi:RNA polymerase sigma factor (sigma-70 family)
MDDAYQSTLPMRQRGQWRNDMVQATATTHRPQSTMNTRELQSVFLNSLGAHKAVLYKVANAYCQRIEDRADLIQDIIAELWRAFPRFDESRAMFSTWMYKVAVNVAISAQRRDHVRVRDALTLESLAEDLIAIDNELASGDDDMHALRQLLSGFDDISRALILFYLEGFSHDEIAELTGLSATNVATKIHRIKSQLQTAPGKSL